ncbi:hypothetical protein D9M68_598330 [compost metagenome]
MRRNPCSFRWHGHEHLSQDPDRQPRRDRRARDAHRARHGLPHGRRVLARRCRRRARAPGRRIRVHRRVAACAELLEHRIDRCRSPRQRRRRGASGLRLPRRERRVRASVSRRRAGLHRPVARGHRRDGRQGRRQAAHAGGRRALHSRLPGRRSKHRHAGRRGRTHRLARDDQGHGRRRRARHAARGLGRRLCRSIAERAVRGAACLRRRHRDPGARHRRAAPHRDPGVCRPPRPCDPPRRARLLGAAAPPEGDRGSALAGRRCRAARAHGRHRRGRRQSHRL